MTPRTTDHQPRSWGWLGLAATVAVAGLLGHASPAVTERHYLAPGAAADARAARSFGVLAGGRA